MNKHIELLEKEIEILKNNLVRALNKPGVRQDEISALEKKIALKTDILEIVRRHYELC